LRLRIVAAYVLLALVVAGFFCGVAVVAIEKIEEVLISHRLEGIADWYFQESGSGQVKELPPGVTLESDRGIRPMLRDLPPGFHEFDEDGTTKNALIGMSADGTRFAFVEESGAFEDIERMQFLAMAFGVVASVLLAIVLARATAGTIIKPITELARAVERDTVSEQVRILELNDEIGALARAFAERTAELNRFLQRERAFTGDVSHELRTPLTVILGASEVLETRMGDDPDLRGAVERIRRTAMATGDRLAALLLLARSPEAIDAPRLALAPLIEDEIERCRPLLRGKPVDLVFEKRGEAWVLARPELASMAIGNLVRNACLYTERGTVTVRLTDGTLEVEDTGPGLPANVRAQLFERFVRGAASDSTGIGLGLSIVKRIVEHLGWDIRHEYLDGQGSRFAVDFRLRKPTAV